MIEETLLYYIVYVSPPFADFYFSIYSHLDVSETMLSLVLSSYIIYFDIAPEPLHQGELYLSSRIGNGRSYIIYLIERGHLCYIPCTSFLNGNTLINLLMMSTLSKPSYHQVGFEKVYTNPKITIISMNLLSFMNSFNLLNIISFSFSTCGYKILNKNRFKRARERKIMIIKMYLWS